MNKNQKLLITLGSILLAQTIGTAVVFSSNAPKVPQIGHERQRLLADWQLGEINQFLISDERGRHLTIEKVDGEWVFPELHNYPTDQAKVTSFLKRLLAMGSNYIVTSRKDQQVAMAVSANNFQRSVQLVGPEKSSLFYIGNAPTSSYSHVRLDGDDKIWAMAGIDEWQFPTDSDSWYNHKYETMPIPEITSSTVLTIDGQSLNLTLAHESNEDWHWIGNEALDKMPPEQSLIKNALEEISTVEFSTIAGRLEDPKLAKLWDSDQKIKTTLKITTQSQAPAAPDNIPVAGETTIHTIYLWPDKDETTLLFSSGASHVVVVENFNLESFYKFLGK